MCHLLQEVQRACYIKLSAATVISATMARISQHWRAVHKMNDFAHCGRIGHVTLHPSTSSPKYSTVCVKPLFFLGNHPYFHNYYVIYHVYPPNSPLVDLINICWPKYRHYNLDTSKYWISSPQMISSSDLTKYWYVGQFYSQNGNSVQ